tara:strand:+ start:63 stop:299 length:237 start_codon:yes stop_codon:yes gene_type:complete
MSRFEYTPEGCSAARDFLLEKGVWSDEISRRDGYEITGIANKLFEKLSKDLQDFDTLANGEWGSLIDDSKDWKPYDDI